VFVTDENGCCLEVNRAACAMTGYTEAELLAMCIKDLFQPEHAAASHYFQTLKKNGALSCEVEFLHKNGTIRWRSIDAVKLSDTCYLGFTKDVTERKKAEEFLQASLAEKEVLLREVHHRVKNNLASIVGLIDLQRSAIQEPHAVKMLVELSERIRSMSLVHEKLYRSESLSQINCQEYLDDLIFQLRCSYETRDVHFEVTAEGVEMPLDIAVPFGLIINELVTNALKYAFPDKKPRTGTGDCRIRVLLAQKNETYTLSVADNGVGLPEGFDWITAKTLGLVLVRMLGQHQLGGTYELNQEQGTRFTLTCSAGNIPCVRGTNPPHAA
jgi:PAS domain S-box-containing protein